MAVPAVSSPVDQLAAIKTLDDLSRLPLPPRDQIEKLRWMVAKDMGPCSQDYAAKHAALLLGMYPRADVPDPTAYVYGLVSVLKEYPESVVKSAVDGVSRELRFLPARAEVVAACDKRMCALRWRAYVVERLEAEHDRRERQKGLSLIQKEVSRV